MGFKLHRYVNFSLNENFSFNGKEFMPKTIHDQDFNIEELKILKSVSLIESTLEEGGHIMKTLDVKGTVYSVYLATKNNALWLMTNDDEGRNEDFNYVDQDKDLENPYLIIEIRSKNEPRKTFVLDPDHLSLIMREDPQYNFEDSDSSGEQFEILKEWPQEISACLTEYAFDKLHIRIHNQEIVYTQEEIVLNDEDGDISDAFGKDNREFVKDVLTGDAHQYFEYGTESFQNQYEDAYKMLDVDNLKEVLNDYQISSLAQFKEMLEEENDLAEELKDRLVRSYVKAQEDVDQERCRKHVIDTIEEGLSCRYANGSYYFTHGEFGKYVPRMSISNASVSNLFKDGDIRGFQFHDYYHGTIDREFFNIEFVETKE